MANYDIFIFDGHGNSNGTYDPGAVGSGKQEHKEAVKLNDKICSLLKPTGLKIHRGVNNYKNNLLNGNTYKFKFGISTHFNASENVTATGTEILVQGQEKYIDMEDRILKGICKLTGLQNRGLKSRDYNSENWVIRKPNVTVNITDYFKELREARNKKLCLAILEVAFITNKNDMRVYDNNFNDIAFIIASEIAKECNLSLEKEKPLATLKTPLKEVPKYTTGLYKVNVDVLNIRKEASVTSKVNGQVLNGGVYTITAITEKDGYVWGKLKSGAGFICLNHCIKR